MTERTGTQALAEFASTLQFEDLSGSAVHAAKRCVLDAIGCGIYGSRLPWCAIVLNTMRRLDGSGKTTVWGTDARLSAPSAALINGTMVHSFEFDDLHKEAIIHPGGVSLPAIFGAAETDGDGATGRDVIVAVVAAYEVSIRVGLATGLGLLHRGWHNNGVLGTFGAAAGAGRLLNLDPPAMQDAIGMAASQSSGLMSAQYGSMFKRMHAGKASQSGLYAAYLAAEGFRGIRDVFEVDYGGFHNTFTTEYSLAELTKGLGESWEIERVGFKPYPACGSNHTSIDAILALRDDFDLVPGNVRRVDVRSSTATRDHVGWKYVPDTVTTAQMNLPFAIACALVNGRVDASCFEEGSLRDPSIVAMTERIHVDASPEIDAKGRSYRHEVELTVHMVDGTALTKSVTHARGSEHYPLADDELDEKFRGLVEPIFGSRRAESLRRSIRDLDRLDAIVPLVQQLGASSQP